MTYDLRTGTPKNFDQDALRSLDGVAPVKQRSGGTRRVGAFGAPKKLRQKIVSSWIPDDKRGRPPQRKLSPKLSHTDNPQANAALDQSPRAFESLRLQEVEPSAVSSPSDHSSPPVMSPTRGATRGIYGKISSRSYTFLKGLYGHTQPVLADGLRTSAAIPGCCLSASPTKLCVWNKKVFGQKGDVSPVYYMNAISGSEKDYFCCCEWALIGSGSVWIFGGTRGGDVHIFKIRLKALLEQSIPTRVTPSKPSFSNSDDTPEFGFERSTGCSLHWS